ncbi:Hypothetical protein NTJ_06114 [Nesidiocoris tenuis]|uniref:Serpin domain-containing protein n=1 Tax=Nesidiocoris tenuis TaxID=355587 RepID=A0ABN7AM54_9HEMI|nr:Hypothetical protein NTJ_06114 [Nesidiocoris tenuis]
MTEESENRRNEKTRSSATTPPATGYGGRDSNISKKFYPIDFFIISTETPNEAIAIFFVFGTEPFRI